jgi:hypothetical protein
MEEQHIQKTKLSVSGIFIAIVVVLVIGGLLFVCYQVNMTKVESAKRICFSKSMCTNYCPVRAITYECDKAYTQNRGLFNTCNCLYGGVDLPLH